MKTRQMNTRTKRASVNIKASPKSCSYELARDTRRKPNNQPLNTVNWIKFIEADDVRYIELQFCLLFVMGVKLGHSH